jgi:hypothetical protein
MRVGRTETRAVPFGYPDNLIHVEDQGEQVERMVLHTSPSSPKGGEWRGLASEML